MGKAWEIAARIRGRILKMYMSCDVFPFWGHVDTAPHMRSEIPQKRLLRRQYAFQAQRTQY